jgi:hypothetical protein
MNRHEYLNCSIYSVYIHEIYTILLQHCSWTKRRRNEKEKHLSKLYDQDLVTYISQMFCEGAVSGPADITYVLNFSPHVVKQVSRRFFLCKCSQVDQTIYTTCKSTFLLPVLFQTPYEISFALPSSPCVHTGSGAHLASYPVGTGGLFPGGKARPGRDADHSPHIVPRLSMSRSYTSSPPMRLHGM